MDITGQIWLELFLGSEAGVESDTCEVIPFRLVTYSIGGTDNSS